MDTLNSLQLTSKSNCLRKFMGSSEMKTEFVWHSADNQTLPGTIREEFNGYGRRSVIKN